MVLNKLGYRADVASNGLEAVNTVEIGRYDLVLMDVQMPEMDGFEATETIRAAETAAEGARLPIIAMTKGDRERCLEHGMDDYIAKPIKPDALLEALEKWPPRKTQAGEPGRDTEKQALVQAPSSPSCAPTQGSVSAWDRNVLLERLMGDEELVAQLVEAAHDDLPCQVSKLKDSLAAADITTSERQAHTIKGAAANIGAEPLRNVAERTEKAARQGYLESCREALPVLEQEFEHLRREMEQYRKEHTTLGDKP